MFGLNTGVAGVRGYLVFLSMGRLYTTAPSTADSANADSANADGAGGRLRARCCGRNGEQIFSFCTRNGNHTRTLIGETLTSETLASETLTYSFGSDNDGNIALLYIQHRRNTAMYYTYKELYIFYCVFLDI